MRIMGVKLRSSLVPRPSEGGGEGRPGIHCMHMHALLLLQILPSILAL